MADPADVEAAEAVLSWKDLAAASRHQAVRSRVWVALVPVGLLLLWAAVVAPLLVLRVMAVLLLLFVVTIPLWAPTAATWMQARRRAWPTTPTKWTVRSDGLAIENHQGRSTLPWSSLTGIDPWRSGVSLRLGRAVAFLPNRAFSSAEHRQAFVARAQALMGGAGPAGPEE